MKVHPSQKPVFIKPALGYSHASKLSPGSCSPALAVAAPIPSTSLLGKFALPNKRKACTTLTLNSSPEPPPMQPGLHPCSNAPHASGPPISSPHADSPRVKSNLSSKPCINSLPVSGPCSNSPQLSSPIITQALHTGSPSPKMCAQTPHSHPSPKVCAQTPACSFGVVSQVSAACYNACHAQSTPCRMCMLIKVCRRMHASLGLL